MTETLKGKFVAQAAHAAISTAKWYENAILKIGRNEQKKVIFVSLTFKTLWVKIKGKNF